LLGGFANEERAQIDHAAEVKVAKRRPRGSPKRTAFSIRNDALFGGLAGQERAQINDAGEFKVVKRRPLEAKEESSDDGTTVARKRPR